MKNDVFGPIITSPDAAIGERRRRLKLFDFQSVNPKLVEQLVEEGWTIDRELKTKIRLKRPKKQDEVLENRVWCLFQRMGFPVLNQGRGFKVTFKRQDSGEDTKQIDVFAKDEETVVVIECKSKVRMDKKICGMKLKLFAIYGNQSPMLSGRNLELRLIQKLFGVLRQKILFGLSLILKELSKKICFY
ncbi:hypothetical protein N9Y31_00265 [Alphaproteobacteria bacterium]|nr:hypothetical protein [Alphaproteobacteria bacterium]